MIDLKLDKNNDLFFDTDLNYVDEIDEVKQSVKLILQTRLNEFSFSEELGLNFQAMLGEKFSESRAYFEISEALKEEPRITHVYNIDFIKFENRELTINIEFQVDDDTKTDLEVAMIA